VTPARSDLFEVDDDLPLIEDRRQKLFYRLVYKIYFCAPRGRKDLQLATSFLTTRVGKCNEKDYAKLRRLVNYIDTTKHKVSVVGIEDIGILHTYIDASYAVHPNMRSHSGGAISFGTGLVASTSQKQKLNVRSSTEAEIVGVDDVLSKVLFIDLFMAE